MAAAVFIFTLTAFCLVRSHADFNVSDYVSWKKAELNQWHQLFPSRVLEEERQTIDAALQAMSNLNVSLSKDFEVILTYPTSKMESAKKGFEESNGKSCPTNKNKLSAEIDIQTSMYTICINSGQYTIARLKSNWTLLNSTYQAAYQRALAGIDACATAYPDSDEIDRLHSCVESMNNNYFTAANNTQSAVSPSPSMTYFQNTVVECASNAVKAVVAMGSQLLDEWATCAADSGTIGPTTYDKDVTQWKRYYVTLSKQILDSQKKIYSTTSSVEKDMISYFKLQKEALEKAMMESRGWDFYFKKTFSYFDDYYNSVTATSLDNPGVSGCAITALVTLDDNVHSGAVASQWCHVQALVRTRTLLSEIYNSFVNVTNVMPSIGNVAVLNCLSQGYVFAPNTIKDCFELSSSAFAIDYSDRYDSIVNSFAEINKHAETFYSNGYFSCGGTSIQRLLLVADKVLYDMQRCLYKSSRTTYEVTSPNHDGGHHDFSKRIS